MTETPDLEEWLTATGIIWHEAVMADDRDTPAGRKRFAKARAACDAEREAGHQVIDAAVRWRKARQQHPGRQAHAALELVRLVDQLIAARQDAVAELESRKNSRTDPAANAK